jgi:hypothetical protein
MLIYQEIILPEAFLIPCCHCSFLPNRIIILVFAGCKFFYPVYHGGARTG